jgi:tetratricopeptide (TPR) repeat protein
VIEEKKMRLASTLLFVALLLPSQAFADDVQAARDHYKRGTMLYDLTRYHEAALEYEKAFEAKDDPALLFNIAQAHRLAGEYNDAIRMYRSFLRRVPDTSNRTEVESRITEMQELINKQEKTKSQPPTGTLQPAGGEAVPPATTTTTTTPTAQHNDRPVYKKWWFWTIIGGVVVAGAAVGVGVGVAQANKSNFNASLGTYGPGALTVVFP